MSDEYEDFYRVLDARYGLSLIPRVRKAQVTDAASPNSYSIKMPGETTARAGVASVSPIVPQVNQWVRVELVENDPTIVGVYGVPLLPAWAEVTTNQSTTSTAYTDLATVGPQVTVALVNGQTVLVTVSCRALVSPTPATFQANMSFEVTGATTLGAIDMHAAETTNTASHTITRVSPFTATATGDHTFKARYKVINATTGSFLNRRITVAAP